MIIPVANGRLLAGIHIKIAVEEVAEILARRVDIFAIPVDEVHRHIEHIVGIAFIAEAVFKDEGQHARARGIRIGPDVRAVGEIAVGLALRERRIGEERGA